MSALEICCAAEGTYVAHSAAMLHSVLAHNQGDVQIHYLHGPGFRPRTARRLAAMVRDGGGSISFLEVSDDRCAGLPTRGFTRKATWYRIFLPELLPETTRVLYLDSDLIVLGSLDPLWRSELTDRYIGAVTNVFQHNHLHRPARLGLAGPQVYFNAGVMLMNLELMRHDGCSRALKRYGIEHADELEWRDQDALNVVLGPRRLSLHPRWNCMNSVLHFPWSEDVFGTEAVAEARRRPRIRHFEGPSQNKPWHESCRPEMAELYLAHRSQTPWPHPDSGRPAPLDVVRRAARAARRPWARRAKGVSA